MYYPKSSGNSALNPQIRCFLRFKTQILKYVITVEGELRSPELTAAPADDAGLFYNAPGQSRRSLKHSRIQAWLHFPRLQKKRSLKIVIQYLCGPPAYLASVLDPHALSPIPIATGLRCQKVK